MLTAYQILEYYKKHQILPSASQYNSEELSLMYKLLHLEHKEVEMTGRQQQKIWNTIQKEMRQTRSIWDYFKVLIPVTFTIFIIFMTYFNPSHVFTTEVVDIDSAINEYVELDDELVNIDSILDEFTIGFENLLLIEVVEAADDFEGALEQAEYLDFDMDIYDNINF